MSDFDPVTHALAGQEEKPKLRLVDVAGQLLCEDCQRARAELDDVAARLRDAEKDLQTKRARIRELQNDKEKERKAYVRKSEVEAVFGVWKDATGHTRSKLTADRFDAIRARLEEGYTAEQIALAIRYIAAFPYTTGPGTRAATGPRKDRWDDIELICRKGSKLERWANLGHEMGAER